MRVRARLSFSAACLGEAGSATALQGGLAQHRELDFASLSHAGLGVGIRDGLDPPNPARDPCPGREQQHEHGLECHRRRLDRPTDLLSLELASHRTARSHLSRTSMSAALTPSDSVAIAPGLATDAVTGPPPRPLIAGAQGSKLAPRIELPHASGEP